MAMATKVKTEGIRGHWTGACHLGRGLKTKIWRGEASSGPGVGAGLGEEQPHGIECVRNNQLHSDAWMNNL